MSNPRVVLCSSICLVLWILNPNSRRLLDITEWIDHLGQNMLDRDAGRGSSRRIGENENDREANVEEPPPPRHGEDEEDEESLTRSPAPWSSYQQSLPPSPTSVVLLHPAHEQQYLLLDKDVTVIASRNNSQQLQQPQRQTCPWKYVWDETW